LNEQDAEPTCTVLNVTQDTMKELNQPHGFKAATAKYGVTKLTSPMLIF